MLFFLSLSAKVGFGAKSILSLSSKKLGFGANISCLFPSKKLGFESISASHSPPRLGVEGRYSPSIFLAELGFEGKPCYTFISLRSKGLK